MTVFIPNRYIGNLPSKPSGTTKKHNTKAAYIKLHSRVQRCFLGLPRYEKEIYFHPSRKWRMDYGWPELKIAVEIHGGHHSQGRHTRGTGFANDREKMNEAQLLDWIVIEATSDNLKDLRSWVEKAFALRGINV